MYKFTQGDTNVPLEETRMEWQLDVLCVIDALMWI